MNKSLTEIYENMNSEGKRINISKPKSVNRTYISCDFTWALFFYLFVYFSLCQDFFYLIIFCYFLEASLCSNEKQKWYGFGSEERWGEAKRIRVMRNHNRDILLQKEKSVFNKMKNI